MTNVNLSTLLPDMLRFIQDPENNFVGQTVTTLQLALVPIVLAIIISLPLGVAVARQPVGAFLAANFSGALRAIPTIAFFAVVLPFLGLGFVPTVVALTLLGIPPILLNTVAGLRSIDPAVLDAARGMGMTRWQRLLRVEAPLVSPVVAAGVRTSAVQIVATVPVAGLIGGGGYGDYILAGVNVLDWVQAAVGALGIAVLALAVELILATVQRALTPAGVREEEQPVGPSMPEQQIATPAAA
jgi:osmoprotectant transport system permease protein